MRQDASVTEIAQFREHHLKTREPAKIAFRRFSFGMQDEHGARFDEFKESRGCGFPIGFPCIKGAARPPQQPQFAGPQHWENIRIGNPRR